MPRTKETSIARERVLQKLRLAYYDTIAPDIEALLAEFDALVAERDALRVQNEKLRITLEWAFAQLRDWWRGTKRDLGYADAAIVELDRMERAALERPE